MAERTAKIGRIALREEGANWNAYYALPGSMQDAIFLGSIRMAAVVGKPERKNAFIAIMRDLVGDILEEATGQRPTWREPEIAPESERSGSA